MLDTNVLQICSYYVGSKLYQNLFRALEELGVQQCIYVYTHEGYAPSGNWAQNVLFAPCYKRYERLFFHLKHKRVYDDIKARVAFDQYTIAHAHSLFSNGYIAYRINQLIGLPYVVAVRNTDVNVFFKRMPHLRNLGIDILRNASSIIFISQPYKQYTLEHFIPESYRDMFREKSIVLPNGIDDFWLDNRFMERKPPEQGTINIIYVGTIDQNKNVATTIAACNILLNEGYNVNFTVVGKMVSRKYERVFAKYPFVRYIPHCAKTELIDYYREADIFAMPSKHETFGLVYAEAMSQGLPVIYTKGQGFDGQFPEREVGFSVAYDDPEEIAMRVKEIIADYGSISKRAVANVHRYDWKGIAQDYSELYSRGVVMQNP